MPKMESLIKKMDYIGRRYHKLGVIDHIGALSQLNFRNAITFVNQEIRSTQENTEEDHSPVIERLSEVGQKIYEFSHYRT